MKIKLNEISSKLRERIQRQLDADNKARRLPSNPEHKQNIGNESVATDERTDNDAMCRAVRIKIVSFRCKQVDGDNIFGKFFIDALVAAGLIPDDSPKWCTVKTDQVLVYQKDRERTEIEIEFL